jgi:WD40 repeat protein
MASISALRRWLSGDRYPQDARRPPAKVDDTYQTVQDDQPHNPYTEALLLHGHSGPVLKICNIPGNRFVTLSDDTLIIVWDAEVRGKRLEERV